MDALSGGPGRCVDVEGGKGPKKVKNINRTISFDNINTRVGYNMDIIQQSACLVVNPITVGSYCFLFNCTTLGQA